MPNPFLNYKLPPRPRDARIGFEAWQLLTILTLILSFASGVLWFRHVQPQQFEQSFMQVESSKHVLFGQYDLLVSELNTPSQDILNQTPIQADCGITVLQKAPNNSYFTDSLSNINQISETILHEKREVERLIPRYLEYSRLNRVVSGLESSTSKSYEFYQNYRQFIENILAIQKQAVQICLASKDGLSKEIATLEKLVQVLPDYRFESFYPWKENLLSFVQTSKALEKNLQEGERLDQEVFTQNLSTFNEKFEQLFRIKYDESSTKGVIFQILQDVSRAIKNVEDWQSENLKQEPRLTDKVVFIFDR